MQALPLSLPPRRLPLLLHCGALAACVGALLAQGCAQADRKGAAPPAAPAQAVESAPAPAAGAAPAAAPASPLRRADAEAQSPAAQAEPPAQATEQGEASWYGASLHRRRTASGERFDMHDFTAAHPRLPFGTRVCVRSLVTGREVQVRINDRGPHAANRIIDLSRAAAKALGMLGRGTKPVALTVLAPDDGQRCPLPP